VNNLRVHGNFNVIQCKIIIPQQATRYQTSNCIFLRSKLREIAGAEKLNCFQKGDVMKRLLLCILAMTILVMPGCGDGGVTVVVPVVEPPSITSYQFTQDRVDEFIDGSVNFFAPDSDIDTITVTVFDSRGFEVSRTTALLDLPGVIQGTIPFSIAYITYPIGTFTFSIFLTDFNGNTSNLIVDTFSVP